MTKHEPPIDEISALKHVLKAARFIKHWHDAMKDGSGMVVSADSVFNLWHTIGEHDKLMNTDSEAANLDFERDARYRKIND